MSKISFQTNLISRVINLAPNMRFIARYDSETTGIKSCMLGYEDRSFIYILTVDFEKSEQCIYVGQSKSQYSRFSAHIKKYAFDHIYLFECKLDELNSSEAIITNDMKPLYNRNNNPLVMRYRNILNIDYDEPKTKAIINHHLQLLKRYEQTGLFGFSLNPAIFAVLASKAKEKGCNCSDLLQTILEQLFSGDIAAELQNNRTLSKTNLATTIEYAKIHGCSPEQIKQYLQEENRIKGGIQIGRNWVFPKDTYFPEDRRRKCQKKFIDLH